MAKKKTKKQKEKELDVIYNRLYSVILRYGSAKVIINNKPSRYSPNNNGEYGQRFIKKSGKCNVSYSGNMDYKRRYQTSCFYEDYIENRCDCCQRKKVSLRGILKSMRDHDDDCYEIKEVLYGHRFKKKMRL